MLEFFTMLGAVVTGGIPLALMQARNTRLQIDNAIKRSEAAVLVTVDKLYVRKDVCAVLINRPQGGKGD